MLLNFKKYFNSRIFLLIVICIIFFPSSIFSQNQSDELSIYYPLKVGNVWVFRGMLPEDISTHKVIEYSKKHNAYLVELELLIGKFYQRDEIRENKVHRRRMGSNKLASDFIAEVVLQSPLKEGKSWNAETDARGSGGARRKVLGFVNLKVAAGDFKDVCKIEYVIYKRDKRVKKEEILLRAYEYYAPKVGLIKVETSNGGLIKELVEYKIVPEQ